MIWIEVDDGYVIRRGVAYFSFFVDSDRSSWTRHLGSARRFPSKLDADECLAEIRRRNALVAARNRKTRKDTVGVVSEIRLTPNQSEYMRRFHKNQGSLLSGNRRVIFSLMHKGLVYSDGSGWYHLTKEGKDFRAVGVRGKNRRSA
jgi:hypothetical protein